MKRALRMCPGRYWGASQGLFFMKGTEMEGITFELKYCERCGALALRRSHSSENYCEPCAQLLVKYSFSLSPVRRSCADKRNAASRRKLELTGQAQPLLAVGVLQ